MEEKETTIRIVISMNEAGEVTETEEVEATLLLKDFAVHETLNKSYLQKDSNSYTVTHLATGRFIFNSILHKSIAFKLCRQLQILANMGIIDKNCVHQPDEALVRWVKAVVSAILRGGKAGDIRVRELFDEHFQKKIIAAQGIQMELFKG